VSSLAEEERSSSSRRVFLFLTHDTLDAGIGAFVRLRQVLLNLLDNNVATSSAETHCVKSASAWVGALAATFHAGEIERLVAETSLIEPLEEGVELTCTICEDKIRPRAA